MRWAVKIAAFTATLMAGSIAASIIPVSGLSNCVVRFDPVAISSSQPPKGVRVMYAGWQLTSDDEASLLLVVHNGLEVPVYYRAFTPTDAPLRVVISGEKYEANRCPFGLREFQIPAGASAELLARRHNFPSEIAETARTSIGLYLHLTPVHARPEGKVPDILTTTEPFVLPADFTSAGRGRSRGSDL